jgi:hypothetical protein
VAAAATAQIERRVLCDGVELFGVRGIHLVDVIQRLCQLDLDWVHAYDVMHD